MSSKFTIIGQIFDSSGYSCHTRQLFNALAKDNDVKLITSLTPDWINQVNDKELESIKKEDTIDRIKIIVTHPIYWRTNATNKISNVYLVWEGLYIPESFINEMLNENINKVIVPSEHTKQAIFNTIENLSEEECKLILEKEKII